MSMSMHSVLERVSHLPNFYATMLASTLGSCVATAVLNPILIVREAVVWVLVFWSSIPKRTNVLACCLLLL